MKKIIFALMALMMVLTVNNAYSSNKKEETKMTGPKYQITVFQSNQELGKIDIMLYQDAAPKHTANFDSLVTAGFYDGTAFHRVIPGFMIQGGDPNSKTKPKNTWGYGDPAQTTVPAEFSKTLSHKRGIISAARSADPNSATSQFFICVADCNFLDGQYSIFGEVTSGMEIVDKVVNVKRDGNDNPLETITMKIVKIK